MNFKLILLALLIAFSLCSQASAGKSKLKYPPYPDVWGYDITDDVDTSSVVPLHIEKRLDGDYTIFYRDKDKVSYNVISVFKKEKKKFPNWKELDKYLDSKGKRMFSGEKQFVALSDGKVIDSNSKLPGSSIHCLYVRRTTDDFESKNNEYELSPIGVATRCKEGKECVNEVYFLALSLIKLEDETFFAFDTSYHLFIRFDRDFKTKFKPQHKVRLDANRELRSNFYVLPYSKIEHFFEYVAVGYTGKYTDDINRQFLDWLYEEEQKGALN
ncbi:MAG: hypothetical protein K0R73_12 [Candidatus Midichloriaceae bacterium]|jgi:hypothetical protein|nr:hypothetical protein [Candidatus Midichloriaceae bacterium]